MPELKLHPLLKFGALTLGALVFTGCAQLQQLSASVTGESAPATQKAERAPAPVETRSSVIENPNYVPEKAAPSLGPEFESNSDAEILVFDKQQEASSGVGANLPDIATTQKEQEQLLQCENVVVPDLEARATALTQRLAARLNVETGAAYLAPTAIPTVYQECVGDLRSAVRLGLNAANSPLIPLESGSSQERGVSQNAGSATVLPQLIRACRQQGIPYLVLSTLREVGGKAALTVRMVRIADGVTLSQGIEKVAPPPPAEQTADSASAATP